MRASFGFVLALLLSACAAAPPPPPNAAFSALNIRSIAVGPVGYATYQTSELCTLFIDDDLRSAVARELRGRGYAAVVAGGSIPRSFSAGAPLPQPGEAPAEELVPAHHADGLLSVWIDDYWEHNPCGGSMLGPQYMHMGAVAILYMGDPPVEIWRGRARVEEQGTYSSNDLIWLTTSRLVDNLLGLWPAGPDWKAPR